MKRFSRPSQQHETRPLSEEELRLADHSPGAVIQENDWLTAVSGGGPTSAATVKIGKAVAAAAVCR